MTPLRSRRLARVDRLELVARILRDRPGITAAEVAREVGVGLRTVFRDLDHLRQRGYPIDADRGRGGGLRLHPSWGLGKVLLSAEEALGTLLALAISERSSFPMLSAELARARKKIVDAFPTSERRRIAPLRERVLVGPNASAAVRASYRPPDAPVMRALQSAFIGERVVAVEYAKENGAISARRVEPHAMVINWPAWYLLGYDHLRSEPRTFRFDRFVSASVEETTPFRARPAEVARRCLGEDGSVSTRPL